MDSLFLILAGILLISGLLGSFLPVLPGAPLSWLGLLVFYMAPAVPMDHFFLGLTLLLTLVIFILQYAIPAIGTRFFGGSKSGIIGATVGLVIGIFLPIPFAVLLAPFFGAYIGELLNRTQSRKAAKAAFGSFVGLLASTFMEFLVTLLFFGLFLLKVWEFRETLFKF